MRAAIRAGAPNYILKDTDRAEFIKILRQTHAGKTPVSPYLAHLALNRDVDDKKFSINDRLAQFTESYGLTELELKILLLVADGLSNEEIGDIVHPARETIKGHVKSLFRKLEVNNRTEAAVLAVRDGLS